jgi:ribosomal protein L22
MKKNKTHERENLASIRRATVAFRRVAEIKRMLDRAEMHYNSAVGQLSNVARKRFDDEIGLVLNRRKASGRGITDDGTK